VVSHSKKRPQNLVMARCFDGNLLDLHEFGVDPDTYRPLGSFKVAPAVGVKPMLLFVGSAWDKDESMRRIRGLWMDFFRGETVSGVDVEGLQFVISFVIAEEEGGKADGSVTSSPLIHLRCNRIRTLKSGQKLPRVEVEETGPRLDLKLRRTQPASEEMWKEAVKTPRAQLVSLMDQLYTGCYNINLKNQPKTKKNITTDLIGDKIGRIHTGKQDLSKMQSRKMKGLKKGDIGNLEEDDAILVNDDYDDDDDDVEESTAEASTPKKARLS
jgi:ribosome production factor 2